MGHVKACWQLALLYETGRGAPSSKAEASWYHNLASEQGWPPSQFLVACHTDSSGLSVARAARLYRRAAEAGEMCATNNLSAHFLHVPIDVADHGVASLQSTLLQLNNSRRL